MAVTPNLFVSQLLIETIKVGMGDLPKDRSEGQTGKLLKPRREEVGCRGPEVAGPWKNPLKEG